MQYNTARDKHELLIITEFLFCLRIVSTKPPPKLHDDKKQKVKSNKQFRKYVRTLFSVQQTGSCAQYLYRSVWMAGADRRAAAAA